LGVERSQDARDPLVIRQDRDLAEYPFDPGFSPVLRGLIRGPVPKTSTRSSVSRLTTRSSASRAEVEAVYKPMLRAALAMTPTRRGNPARLASECPR